MTRKTTRTALLVVSMLALSACITVFPKTKPAQLYRFDGRREPAATQPNSSIAKVGVVRAGGSFNAAASGDRILTVTGDEVAYLAETRWAGAAVNLFDEALLGAFNANAGPARLVVRGEPAKAAFTLRLDVQRFEAVYDQGSKAAPDVRMEVHVVLVRAADRALVRDQTISIHERATGNRVSEIVRAFDQAVGQAVSDVVSITDVGVALPAS